MRARKLSSVCLLILYSFMPILSVLLLQHVTMSETLNHMDSGGFGTQYISFAVPSEDAFPYRVPDLMLEERDLLALGFGEKWVYLISRLVCWLF